MKGFISALIGITCLAVCHCAISITTGPTSTTKEVGARFTLKCSIAGKQPTDSVFWKLYPVNSQVTTLLTLDTVSKNPDFYEIQNNTYNLIVKNATYNDDGTFECEAGTSRKTARVYIFDKPESMSLEWEHSINKPGSVESNQEYKLKCVTKNSHPPAVHRYFKAGVELSQANINYTFNNYTDTEMGYGDTTSLLPFTPSEADVKAMKDIRCVADLYNELNVTSVAFGINSAVRADCFGLGAVLVMLSALLLKN